MTPFRVMGIVNVTPDSFSDGGLYLDPQAAVIHGLELAEQGASIVDVGGESTRPGAEPVPVEEELRRVIPVVRGLSMGRVDAQISIDTSKLAVAAAALGAGASLVNDVTAFRADPELAALVAESGADCCLMHMLGEPRTMQQAPRYADVVDDVRAFLEQRLAFAVGEGVAEERIMIDPGIGFGKTVEHNLELLRRLGELRSLGRPIVVGTSRKSFLAKVAGAGAGPSRERPSLERAVTERAVAERVTDARLAGTIATNVLALERGASVFRVHDVAPVVDALRVAAATVG